jgi:hypothetical protein
MLLAAALLVSTAVPLRFTDAQTGAPLAAQAIAWEEYYVGHIHGHSDICFRTAGAAIPPGGGAVTLPASVNLQALASTRTVFTFAFARGHCAWAPRTTAFGLDQRASPSAPIALRNSADPVEYRLRYLAAVASGARSSCLTESDRGFTAALGAEIVSEAQSIAKTHYERFLALRVREALAEGERTRISGALASALRNSGPEQAVATLKKVLEFRRASPTLTEQWCSNGYCQAVQPPKDMFQPVEPFHIDERAEDGYTGLMQAAQSMHIPAMQFLLDEGASVAVLTWPGGIGALDILLLRAEKDVNGYAPDGVEGHLLRAIDLLVKAKATLHAQNRRLLSHPEAWRLEARAQAFWSRVAERIASVPARDSPDPSCRALMLPLPLLRLGTPPG